MDVVGCQIQKCMSNFNIIALKNLMAAGLLALSFAG